MRKARARVRHTDKLQIQGRQKPLEPLTHSRRVLLYFHILVPRLEVLQVGTQL